METGLRVKAFYRWLQVKKFPRLRLTLLLDGLYANGPVIEICRKNKWQFMIVLKDDSLPSVWEEVNGLMRLDTKRENYYERIWQGRQRRFDGSTISIMSMVTGELKF
ncbi:MAG: hypothetical protein RQM95_12745 [Syntrophaceticus schinkii]